MILPRDTYELELARIWESVTGVRPIGVQDAFFDLGGNSLAAEWMLLEVERIFCRSVPQRVLYEASTIEQLAALLRVEGWQPPKSALVALQPNGRRAPLYCFPPLNAISAYRALADNLSPVQPVFALQATPAGDRNPFSRIEEEATYYVSEICARQSRGPYYLAGWSYGGIVAFEVAQQLAARGELTAFLGILDIGFTLTDPGTRLDYWVRRVRYVIRLGPRRQMEQVRRRMRMVAGPRPPPDPNQYPTIFPLPAAGNDFRADYMRGRLYKPKKYAGRVTFFRTHREDYASLFRDPLWGWGRLALHGVLVENVPGDHSSMMIEPHVRELATKFQRHLQTAQEDAAGT